jgi:hypothetical protein
MAIVDASSLASYAAIVGIIPPYEIMSSRAVAQPPAGLFTPIIA